MTKKQKAMASAIEVRRQLKFARQQQEVALVNIGKALDLLDVDGFATDALLIAVKALRMIASSPEMSHARNLRGIAKGALKRITIDDLGKAS